MYLHGYVRLCGCRQKSVSMGLYCSIGSSISLAVTHSASEAACNPFIYMDYGGGDH